MQVNFYNNFYKKDNSTKRPTTGGNGNLTAVHTVTGTLKEPCSILHPIISLQNTPVQSMIPAVCTYAYIPRFFRYYWVSDWSWEDGLWTAHLDVDVLASWKPHIGEQTEYILRTDSTTNFNGEISDMTYPATTDIQTSSIINASPFSPASISSGCYIVGIISGSDPNSGSSTDAVGAITYFIMDSTQFGALKQKLFSNSNLETMGIIDAQGQTLVQDISQEVLKTLYNPYQYIASCMWFPIAISDIVNKTSVTTINIGWWIYSLSGYRLTYPLMNLTETAMNIPVHPQSATRGSYLNYSPYTKISLYGRFGTIPLDPAFFQTGDTIHFRYNIDLITGQCRAVLERTHNVAIDTITEKEFLLGTPIQIAQVGIDYLGAATTAISSAANAAGQLMRLDIGGAIATEVTGIYNTLSTAMPQVETSGGNGSFLSAVRDTTMIVQFYKIVDEDISHRGRPLCELRRIDTLSGFIMCAEGDLDLDIYEPERLAIKKYLTTGFFWE